MFFVKDRLFVVEGAVGTGKNINVLRPVLDSFRLLTKVERTVALIDENMPPPLAQERPANLPPADTIEMGLKGPVSRIQDTFQANQRAERTFFQQVNFDKNGFITAEINFNNDYPDVITTWG